MRDAAGELNRALDSWEPEPPTPPEGTAEEAQPGFGDTLRLAGSPYSTWRDIVLTNRELLSASLDLFARRLDDLRERLASRDLEGDFESANELYKLLRSL